MLKFQGQIKMLILALAQLQMFYSVNLQFAIG
jgi:hypothetical protein